MARMANGNDARSSAAAVLQGWLRQGKDQGVIVLDRHGVILDWLAGAQQVLGYTAQEAIGHHIALIFTHEDRAKGYPDHELAVAAKDKFSEDSRWHLRRDGTRVWVSGSVSAVRSSEGEIQGFVKLIRDMTDERARVERVENELGTLVEARKRNQQFLRVLGHEIRNPLQVLSNAAQVLEGVTTDERGRKVLKLVAAQVEALGRLAGKLMEARGQEHDEVRLELVRLDLREVLEEVAGAMQALAMEKKAVTIEAVLPPTPLWVRADPARLRQVVVNLVANAIKYNHHGGNVWIAASEEGHEVVCRVTDNGIGIFPPVLPRLFELFSQADEGEQRSAESPGIGLVLVRQLVELHGGTVQAKSSGLEKGAEFSFRLPIAGGPGSASGRAETQA